MDQKARFQGTSHQTTNQMKTVIHPSATRGHANHGWLDTHHTFSFAGYYNPERMHFGALRVLNDDIVKGGNGFGKHPHDNMEIVSIPLKGALEHADSTGGKGVIRTGEVQIMSAGSGVTHSERNASPTDDVNFLQIWVFPRETDIAPRYDQKYFAPADRLNRFQTVIGPERNDGQLWINQDASFSLAILDKEFDGTYTIKTPGNGAYVFVLEGNATVAGHPLKTRDGIGVWETDKFSLKAEGDAQVLVIEVPMTDNE